MKHGKRKSRFVDVAVLTAALCGLLIGVGLLIPSLRPLAFQLGTALSLGIIAVVIGVVLYAAWRIVTFPSRSRKAAARARLAE